MFVPFYQSLTDTGIGIPCNHYNCFPGWILPAWCDRHSWTLRFEHTWLPENIWGKIEVSGSMTNDIKWWSKQLQIHQFTYMPLLARNIGSTHMALHSLTTKLSKTILQAPAADTKWPEYDVLPGIKRLTWFEHMFLLILGLHDPQRDFNSMKRIKMCGPPGLANVAQNMCHH